MTNPNVREVGRFTDLDGRNVTVGVDYTAITVSAPFRVDAAGFETFSRLAIAARHQADRCEAESDDEPEAKEAAR